MTLGIGSLWETLTIRWVYYMAVVQWNSINLFVLLPRMRNRHAINVNDAITLVLSVNKCNLVMFRSLTILPCTPWLLHRSRQHVRLLHRHFPWHSVADPYFNSVTIHSDLVVKNRLEGPACERSSWPPAFPIAAFPWTQESVETSARSQGNFPTQNIFFKDGQDSPYKH